MSRRKQSNPKPVIRKYFYSRFFFKHVNISYLQLEINIVSISRFEIKNKLIRKISLWLSASTSKYWKYRYVFLRDDIFPVCRRYKYTFLSYVGRLCLFLQSFREDISSLFSISCYRPKNPSKKIISGYIMFADICKTNEFYHLFSSSGTSIWKLSTLSTVFFSLKF